MNGKIAGWDRWDSNLRTPDTPATIRRHPPLVGEHTEEILRDVLGYDEKGVEKLRQDGII